MFLEGLRKKNSQHTIAQKNDLKHHLYREVNNVNGLRWCLELGAEFAQSVCRIVPTTVWQLQSICRIVPTIDAHYFTNMLAHAAKCIC